MPIYLKKDWNLDKHEYTPADYAMLTVDTTHEQPSNDNGLHELQHIPMIVQLVASVLYGERTNERSGVCPQFVQIPRAEMPIQEAEKKCSFPTKTRLPWHCKLCNNGWTTKSALNALTSASEPSLTTQHFPRKPVKHGTHWKLIFQWSKSKLRPPKPLLSYLKQSRSS